MQNVVLQHTSHIPEDELRWASLLDLTTLPLMVSESTSSSWSSWSSWRFWGSGLRAASLCDTLLSESPAWFCCWKDKGNTSEYLCVFHTNPMLAVVKIMSYNHMDVCRRRGQAWWQGRSWGGGPEKIIVLLIIDVPSIVGAASKLVEARGLFCF